MTTNLLGQHCTFNSRAIHTYKDAGGRLVKSIGNSFNNIHGEIVGTYVSNPRKFVFCCGSGESTSRVILIIRLGTFEKDSLVEIPIEQVKIHNSLEDAKQNCTVE